MLGRLAPPLALMGLIYFLSAQPDLNSGLGDWDYVLRKCAHMTEYGLLWFLWWRALRLPAVWPAWAIVLAYACTDEFHQHFVRGRHGTPVDVAIDMVGVALAVWVTRQARRSPAA